jgi:hypothetical protein
MDEQVKNSGDLMPEGENAGNGAGRLAWEADIKSQEEEAWA